MKLKENDIIIVNKKVVQFKSRVFDCGVVIEDIHTKQDLIVESLIERKATKDETKWFFENSENINLIPNIKHKMR